MGNVYKVIEIQGKSLGCVATQDIPKGTLILVEKPQIVLDHNYGIQIMFQSLRKNVCDGFFSMSKDDVEEYLNLANSYKKENELNERMKEKLEMFKNCGMSGRLLEIMEIYESNCWSDGLGIKMARFNHSCSSNACYYLNKENGLPEIRSLEEIKADSEITVNYMTRDIAMKNRKTRQNKLSLHRGFECCCDLCEKESAVNDDEKYERFEKLNHEVNELQEASNFKNCARPTMHGWSQPQLFQKYKEGISNLKEMYNLTLEKKPSRSFIDNILEDGIQLGNAGYQNYHGCERDFFQKECKFFQKEKEDSVLDPYMQ